MLTRHNFDQMNEAALRRDIIMPLLEAMGYNGVLELHGTGELGRDIVAWKANSLEARENLAIVAKAVKMTGQAGGQKGAAGEVQTQIRQCFDTGYSDPVTGEHQEIHHVWVVSNKIISEIAQNAITRAVGKAQMRYVEFIDGKLLWQFVEKYLPLSILAHAEQLAEQIKLDSPHYKPVVTIIDGAVNGITLQEKYPGAFEAEPLNITLHYKDESAGLTFKAAMQSMVETGEAFSLPQGIVEHVELPEIFKQIMGKNLIPVDELKISPILLQNEVPVKIVITPPQGNPYIAHNVRFKAIKPGTRQVTLQSNSDDAPFVITISMDLANNHSSMSVAPPPLPSNAVRLHEWLQFMEVMQPESVMKVESAQSEVPIFSVTIADAIYEKSDPLTIELMAKLATLQRKLGVEIIAPEVFDFETVSIIDEIYQGVTTGKTEHHWDQCAVSMKLSQDTSLGLKTIFDNGGIGGFQFEGMFDVALCGVQLPPFRIRQILHSAILTNYNQVIAGLTDELTSTELHLAHGPNNRLTYEYLDWDSQPA